MKKIHYRICLSIASLAVVALLLIVPIVVFANAGLVSNFTGNPTSTSIALQWQKASSSDNTTVRYRTDTFPTGPTANDTLVCNTINMYATASNLTAGQVYYFAAWGYDIASGNYSASATYLAMSTLAMSLPTGGNSTSTFVLPIPTLPASANQAPSTTGFNLEPFTSIIAYFNGAPGGLGMPTPNAWESIATFVVIACGVGTYIRTKVFFIAFTVLVLLTFFGVSLHLLQGLLIPIEIIVGAGVWAIERYFQ